MELRHLRYFIALAGSLNFTRAAERLHVTQSTLSHQIRQLENEIGAPLFDQLDIAETQDLCSFMAVYSAPKNKVLMRQDDAPDPGRGEIERGRRAEAPGAAWGYHDFAIQLYARSLDRIFGQPMAVLPLLMLSTGSISPLEGPFASARFNTRAPSIRIWSMRGPMPVETPDAFWLEQAQRLDWVKAPTLGGDWAYDPVAIKWFEDGTLNVSYNCLDRNVDAGKGDKVAIIFEADDGQVTKVSYRQLLERVSQLANGLKSLGIKKGAWHWPVVCSSMAGCSPKPIIRCACRSCCSGRSGR